MELTIDTEEGFLFKFYRKSFPLRTVSCYVRELHVLPRTLSKRLVSSANMVLILIMKVAHQLFVCLFPSKFLLIPPKMSSV